MLSQIVFCVTYDCPVTCKYCVTESGPKGGSYLNSEFMIQAINDISQFGKLRSVVFTGGEALTKFTEVEETIKYADSLGLSTRIVSNAYWAHTKEASNDVLSRLRSAGLSELNLSCDDFHQENIPLENIYNAFWATRELQIPTLIAHKAIKNMKITVDYLSEFLGVKLEIYEQGQIKAQDAMIASGLTVPIGYGHNWISEADYIIYPKDSCVWKTPCASVLNSIIVSPDKDIRLCCGMIDQKVPELNFGRWEDKTLPEKIYEANIDLIANWIALEGPYGLMKFIKEKEPEIQFRDRYVNKCHVCNDVLTRRETREVLMNYGYEKAEEISIRRNILEAIR